MTELLDGLQILNLAYNAPGPAAASRLQSFGARVIKVEPPGGDPLSRYCPAWYVELTAGQTVLSLDLKQPPGRAALEEWLASSDLLITSVRLDSLPRLALDWPTLHARHAHLCHVAITGYPAPQSAHPGHDLTYQAQAGLLDPPSMPHSVAADLAGAERAASAGLALLLARLRGQGASYLEAPLAEAAATLAAPWRLGMTRPGGVAGGTLPGYRLYPALQGWVAVAALEGVFWQRLFKELGFQTPPSAQELGEVFLTRTAQDWQAWAEERDLPVARVV